MITGYYCANIFTEHAESLIMYYTQILELPFIKTDDDEKDGVYLGFSEDAPMICIWDCQKWGAEPTGRQSFVFNTKNLDLTIEQLRKKGISVPDPVRYEWGTYEVRLQDTDGNENVLIEY